MGLGRVVVVSVAVVLAVVGWPASALAQGSAGTGDVAGERGTAASWAPQPLRRGDVGPGVADWQRDLNGWLEVARPGVRRLTVDGIFGPLTARATRAFQEATERVATDGVVHEVDRFALRAEVALASSGDVLPVGPFTTGPVTGGADGTATGPAAAGPAPAAELTGVTLEPTGGFDRIELELAGPDVTAVGYRAGYVPGPLVAPSGATLDVGGTEVLEIRLPGVTAPAAGGPTGPVPGDLAVVVGAGIVDDGAGGLRYAIGTRTRMPFAVGVLSDPLRLVIDVATPATAVRHEPLVRCQHAAGITLARPASWHVVDGEGIEPCSQFHPEELDVPDGDRRVAAISATVEDVPFDELVAPDPARRAQRALAVVDGHRAARLEHDAGEVGFWPAGTPVVVYVVELPPGPDGRPRSLLLDTAGVGGFDFDLHRAALDRLATTVAIDGPGGHGTAGAPLVVAGAGAEPALVGTAEGPEVCLQASAGDRVCVVAPGARQVRRVDVGAVVAGLAGAEVFAVTAIGDDGTTTTVLPTPIDGASAAGFGFTAPDHRIDRLVAVDQAGRELAVTEVDPPAGP